MYDYARLRRAHRLLSRGFVPRDSGRPASLKVERELLFLLGAICGDFAEHGEYGVPAYYVSYRVLPQLLYQLRWLRIDKARDLLYPTEKLVAAIEWTYAKGQKVLR